MGFYYWTKKKTHNTWALVLGMLSIILLFSYPGYTAVLTGVLVLGGDRGGQQGQGEGGERPPGEKSHVASVV